MSHSEDDMVLEVNGLSKSFAMNKGRSDSLKSAMSSLFRKKTAVTECFDALTDISFTLHKGESLGIIGENGAGKSTLLKVLSGITYPDSGIINFYGKAASILDVGAGFHPELSGRENIYLTGSLYQFSRKEIGRHLEEIIEFSGVEKFIDEPVKNYSSGMYLRLAFSIITCIEADIYLIDEVISVGDANFQSKCRNKIEELMSAGKTMIIASHNLNEIITLCNRILLLEHGKVKQDGSNDVIQQYMTQALPEYFRFAEGKPFHIAEIKNRENDKVSILSCALEDVSYTEKGIRCSEPLKICFTIAMREAMNWLPRIKVFDSTGVMVFTGSLLEQEAERREAGKYRIEYLIPPNVFNGRMYFIDFMVINIQDKNMVYTTDKCITVKMSDDRIENETDRLLYLPGLMKPKVITQVFPI